jgi:hypothetical protein
MAVNRLLEGGYPEDHVYVSLLPKDFDRPSFLLEMLKFKKTDATRHTVAVEAGLSITCFVDVDGHYNSDVEKLLGRQSGVMDLFACGFLAVGDRCLHAQAAEGIIDFDECCVELSLDYFDDRPSTGETAPLIETVKTNINPEG